MEKRILYIIVGTIAVVLIAVGIGAFFIFQGISPASAQQPPTPTPAIHATTSAQKGSVTAKILKQYAPNIKSQVAQGLHLTTTQLTTDLQSGKTLSTIATAQNVSSTQLQTLVVNAVQNSLQPAVSAGTLTTQQVHKLAKRYEANPTLLDHLLGGKATQKVTPTPVPAQ